MNWTNDFVSMLMNNREKIVDKLLQNYSYEHLLKIFQEINKEKDNTITITPNDKRLYRLLTGLYESSRYDKSSIDWIPSSELVNGIINLANYYEITSIEELYTGMGIMAALLIKELENKNINISVTAADTSNVLTTCNKLGLISIAKRNAADYKYYKQLNEPYPQMIISTYHPITQDSNKQNMDFMDDICELISSGNHNIIIIFAPFTFTSFYETFYHLTISSNYTLTSFNVKALDKYYYIVNLLNKYYKSAMIAHIFIKNDLLMKKPESLNKLFEPAMIPDFSILSDTVRPSSFINTHCHYARWLKIYYDIASPKLVKSIYRNCDMTKPLTIKSKMKTVISHYSALKYYKFKQIPPQIYDLDEYIFWIKRVMTGSYFVFQSRNEFFTFYTNAINIHKPEIKERLNIPPWAKYMKTLYEFVYLDSINKDGNWRSNFKGFKIIMENINQANKILLS